MIDPLASPCRAEEPSRSALHPRPHDAGAAEAAIIAASGLFDAAFYRDNNPDIASTRTDPLDHFVQQGWREGRLPNPYFHPEFYLRQNPEAARAGFNALLHYLIAGEAEGRAPSPYFDLAWYRTRHDRPAAGTYLRHFLERRCDGTVSPLPEFDPHYYLTAYVDVREAGVDPCEHYLLYGFREGRNPSAEFDTRYYLHRYLDGETQLNPLLHYRQFRHILRLHPTPPPHETSVYQELQRNLRPGPLFEPRTALPRSARRLAKLLAYYLPQFHAIPENDKWWGDGFTEWTSIARGVPRFVGHYQPRSPRDLGHYTLGGTDIMRRQIEMARDAGLFGFVQYFYWFNGRRLLERPLEAFLADPTLDFPFCLMWTNENWTRRWDGSEDDVLISQDYRPEDDDALVDSFARHFRDARYIRVQGRPLLMVYRPALIPDTAATVARWRDLFAARHGEHPILVMAQSFDCLDPRPHGFDGAIEFPPHKLTHGLNQRNPHLTYLDTRASAQVFAYDDVAAASLAEPALEYPRIKTIVPSWDNDARRQGAGLVLEGATPAKYQAWLEGLVARSATEDFFGERFVCVNAWNEWAEGAYLEPDVHFGSAYLNATGRAVAGLASAHRGAPLLLVGHDAFPAGAQYLLLHLGRALRRGFGVDVAFVLLGDGELRAEYEAVAPVRLATSRGALEAHAAECVRRGATAALVNTSAAAWAAPVLREAGLDVVLLVHEMPRLIAEKRLLDGARAGVAVARAIVFPAPVVRDAFASVVPIDPAKAGILPQGSYRAIVFDPDLRARHRQSLGLARATALVVGVGYGDLRKGFDLFLQAWRAAMRDGTRAVFCWVGALDPAVRSYLGAEVEAATAAGTFLLPGHQADVAPWLCAADAFVLASREDPYPTAAVEARCAGLPVVAFEGSGGVADMLRDPPCGILVPMGDTAAVAGALRKVLARRASDAARRRAGDAARARADFGQYAAAILRLVQPSLPVVSVAVLSYNYARYLSARLASVFAQTLPVAEILLLDDASDDGSIEVAVAMAADWSRDLRVIRNPTNGGSVFAQWRRAATEARGDWVWIAEADDEADPVLLERLAGLLATAPDIDMAFCDSRSIDADGTPVWPSYQTYYARNGADALARTGLFDAADFARRFLSERNLVLNVSAVLWRRTALVAALEQCGAELTDWRVAGDWRVYVELLARSPGTVAYLAEPRNVHRRHAASVTHATPPDTHAAEIDRMRTLARERLGIATVRHAEPVATRPSP